MAAKEERVKPRYWEFKLFGIVPDGVSDQQMEAMLVSSIMTVVSLQPWQRANRAAFHTEPPLEMQASKIALL